MRRLRGHSSLMPAILCLLFGALLITGCGQPAPFAQGGPVDLPVRDISESVAVQPRPDGASTQVARAEKMLAAGAQTEEKQITQAEKAPAADAQPDGAGASGAPAAGATGTAPQKEGAAASVSEAEGAKAADPQADPPKAPAAPQTQTGESNRPVPQETPPKQADPQPPAQGANVPAAETGNGNANAVRQAETAQPQTAPAPVLSASDSSKASKDSRGPAVITFKDLYSDVSVRGMKLSDKMKELSGKKVEMTGFMAPPLSATVRFFVLTKVALTVCPFCSSDADWPADIVVVFMPKGKDAVPTEHQVKVTGTLSTGSQTDEETGFVSLIRIMADKVEVLK